MVYDAVKNEEAFNFTLTNTDWLIEDIVWMSAESIANSCEGGNIQITRLGNPCTLLGQIEDPDGV